MTPVAPPGLFRSCNSKEGRDGVGIFAGLVFAPPSHAKQALIQLTGRAPVSTFYGFGGRLDE